ncbi:YqgE/AlgH family protein [Endozoicomonadaceae bacterium StTr2]
MENFACSSLRNHFLIAMPQLSDPSFTQTLTLICEHNKQGAIGIVLNRPTELTLGDVFKQIGIEELDEDSTCLQDTIYVGGPVAQERGFVLHSGPAPWQSSLGITTNLKLTTSRDVLEALAKGDGPEYALVALGYAGWGAGQLEDEILQNAWLTCEAKQDIIFRTPPLKRMAAAADLMGIDLHLLSGEAGHA